MPQPYYIKAFQTGLEKDKPDFKLMEDAFSTLNDAFIWRERIARKKGYKQIGRLTRLLTAQALGNTTGTPHAGNIKTTLVLEANSEIEQGSVTIHVAAPNAENYTEPAVPDGTLVGDGGGTGTINYFTGAFTIVSGAGWGAGQAITIDFNYCPALPCMGLVTRELATINQEQSVAFDTIYVYFWNAVTERFEEAGGGTTWQGDNTHFFYAMNYYSATTGGDVMFATNFNKSAMPDPIRYYDNVAAAWNNWLPPIDGAGNEMHQCRILVRYKGRIVALNTWEGATSAAATQNPRRARWSWNGDPLAATAWRSDTPGLGGYIDAPTSEHIISAGFVRDTLVVGFEQSVWRLRYTGNEILPFVWERIDNEFGIESQYSIVRVDEGQIGVGDKGIIACDGMNVDRIDIKIPDFVFTFHNANDGVRRVHGTRDYDKKLIYWTFPSAAINRTYPDMVLVFNYENGSWSTFHDSLTCFGTLQYADNRTWADYPATKWELAEFAWVDASLQSLYPELIAGNQHGFVVNLQRYSRNDPAFAITVVTPGTPVQLTIPDHNLSTGDYIYIIGMLGTAGATLNGNSYRVNFVDANNVTLSLYNGTPVTVAAGSTYLGGGQIAWLHDFRARMKKFNFLEQGVAGELSYMDLLVNQTTDGQFNVDIFADHNDTEPMNVDDTFFNTTVLTTADDNDLAGQNKVLHRFYSRMHSSFFQFEFNLTGEQKVNGGIHDSDIEIYALTLWSSPGGRII